MASDAAFSGSKIQIAFLGETKRTIPRSRPASGRASRAGLVQDAACGTGAQRRLVLDETEHGAMLVQVGPPASSKTATPSHVLRVIPGDRDELLECHSEATRGRAPVSPDRPTKIVLRRSVESAIEGPVTAGATRRSRLGSDIIEHAFFVEDEDFIAAGFIIPSGEELATANKGLHCPALRCCGRALLATKF